MEINVLMFLVIYIDIAPPNPSTQESENESMGKMITILWKGQACATNCFPKADAQ